MYLAELKKYMGTVQSPGAIYHKFLERARGYLNHIGITFEMIVLLLRGFHNTLDSWRCNRNYEGWKVEEEVKWVDILDAYLYKGQISNEIYDVLIDSQHSSSKPPKLVLPAPRLHEDVEMLQAIFSAEQPTKYPVRFGTIATVHYGFRDASGRGFGSIWKYAGDITVNIELGTWSVSEEEEQTSNWQEFENVVNRICQEADAGRLKNAIIFMFTDNSVVEGAIAKGNSATRKLFKLVLRLRTSQMKSGYQVYMIHIFGERIVAQGTDSLSCGKVCWNVKNFEMQVPLHLSALQRYTSLKRWIKS